MRLIVTALGAATLLATSAGAAEPTPVAAAAPPVDPLQQIVCRRDVETGSLVRAKKTCHTRAQWRYIDDTNQSFSRDLADSTRSKPSGGN